MMMLVNLLTTGNIAIPILVLTMFEAAALLLYRHATSRGPSIKSFLPNLLAGDFLLLAWLANTTHQAWSLTAVALLAALVSHATDMALRWA